MGASRAVLELQEVGGQSDDVSWLNQTVKSLVKRARKEDYLGKHKRAASRHTRDTARRKLHEEWTTFQSTTKQQRHTGHLVKALREASEAIPQPTLLRGARHQVEEVSVLEDIRGWGALLDGDEGVSQLKEAAKCIWRWKYHPEISRDVCRVLLRWVVPDGAAQTERIRARLQKRADNPGNDDEESESEQERQQETVRVLQDAGVPGTLWQVISCFNDHPVVPFAAVPLLSKLSVELTIRMMEMQLDEYLTKREAPTRAFMVGLRCLSTMARDEYLRAEIVEGEGRELIDYTMTSKWSAHCKLELEGARRRLLVESLRVARLADEDSRSGSSERNIEDAFTQEQLDDLREAFNAFDTDQSGDIDSNELGAIMRKLGLNPQQHEIDDMIRAAENGAVDGNFDGKVDWHEFLHLMARNMDSKEVEDEYMKCFEYFAKDQPYIDVPSFVNALHNLGQDFSDDELDLLICNSKFEDDSYDRITYKEFVKMMMAQ